MSEKAAEPATIPAPGMPPPSDLIGAEVVVQEPPAAAPEPTTGEKLKAAIILHQEAIQASHEADEHARHARIAKDAASKLVNKLALDLLSEGLGSQYSARAVIYNLSGREPPP